MKGQLILVLLPWWNFFFKHSCSTFVELSGLNGRTCWSTLISAFCTLVENEDDRLYVVYNGGLQMTFEVSYIIPS